MSTRHQHIKYICIITLFFLFAGEFAIAGQFNFSSHHIDNRTRLIFNGTQVNDVYGYEVTGVGDFNGDGFDDFAISAPQTSFPLSTTNYVDIRSGIDGQLIRTLQGSATGQFGVQLAGGGDVDQDGKGDVIISETDIGTPNRVIVETETNTYTLTPPPGSSQFSYGVFANAGDINGDGYDDVVVSDPGYAGPAGTSAIGKIYVYSGSGLANATIIASYEHPSLHSLGLSVAGGGDINDDGFDDIIASTFGNQFLVFFGQVGGLSTPPVTITSPGSTQILPEYAQTFIQKVAIAGDINADGFSDILVKSETFATDEVLVYFGNVTGVDPTPISVLMSNSLFGYTVASAGNFDGKGGDEIIIADPIGNQAGNDRLYVYTYNEQTHRLDLQSTFLSQSNAAIGPHLSAASAGDTNGTGIDEIIVGTPFSTIGGLSAAGQVRVLRKSEVLDYGIGFPNQTLRLDWVKPTDTELNIQIEGGPQVAGQSFTLMVSSRTDHSLVPGGGVLLVDFSYLLVSIIDTFNGQGNFERTFNLNNLLNQPAGTELFLQAFWINSGNWHTTPGLQFITY